MSRPRPNSLPGYPVKDDVGTRPRNQCLTMEHQALADHAHGLLVTQLWIPARDQVWSGSGFLSWLFLHPILEEHVKPVLGGA